MRLSPPKSLGIPAESGHAQLEESRVTAHYISFAASFTDTVRHRPVNLGQCGMDFARDSE